MFSTKDCLSQKISEICRKRKLLIMKPIDKNMKEPDFNKRRKIMLSLLKTNHSEQIWPSAYSRKANCKRSLSKLPITLSKWRRKFTNQTRFHWNSWSNWKMLKLRSLHYSNILLTSNKESLFTFQSRMIAPTRNLLSSLTTTRRDPSSRSCSCVKVRAFINSDLKE